jgi:hypothetical protein
MIDLPLPVSLPAHARAKPGSDMVPQFGMFAANRVSRTGAAPESHTGAAEHVAVHPEGRFTNASQLLSMARLGGIAGDALPVAYIPLGLVSLSAWRCRVETRKAALGGLCSGYCV